MFVLRNKNFGMYLTGMQDSSMSGTDYIHEALLFKNKKELKATIAEMKKLYMYKEVTDCWDIIPVNEKRMFLMRLRANV